jgi:hypothetical protein
MVTRRRHGAIITANKNGNVVDQGKSAMPGIASWIGSTGKFSRRDP